jgi:CPA2 family monovalent cation:H+ antiporter-2
MAKRPNNMAYKELWLNPNYNRGPLLIIEICRIILGIVFIVLWISKLAPTGVAFAIGLLSTVLVLWIFSSRIRQFYQRIESRFMSNLNA